MKSHQRTWAETIIRLRAIIIDGFIERLADRPDDDLAVRFDAVANDLPLGIRGDLQRRVSDVAARMVERNGIMHYIDHRDIRAIELAVNDPDGWRA